ncbi:MAG: hypothetical protein HQK83_03460 [Fibrobacteria bacterium]|nr:hypothetical protein [Fibrobacteria bacterium]
MEFICQNESIEAEPEALSTLATRADGSMRDALSLFDQVYAFSGASLSAEAVRQVLGIPPDELYDELLRAVIAQDKQASFTVLRKFYDRGIDIEEILRGFGMYLHTILYVKQADFTPEYIGISAQRHAHLLKLSEHITDGDILRYTKTISDIMFELKASPNALLTLEMGVARLASLDRVVSLSELISSSQLAEGQKKK